MVKDISVRKRALIKVGDSLAITLPATWVKRMKLQAGDQIITVAEDFLLVVPVSLVTMPKELASDA